MKYKLNSFWITNTIHFISSNQRVWITSICIINISVYHIAIKSSTSLSSSSIIEVNSEVCVLPSCDSRATVKSSISSSLSSINSPGSPANGGIGSHKAGWNFSVSAMCFAPTSSSWSGHSHKALILILINTTCSSSFSNATVFRKSFNAQADVVPVWKNVEDLVLKH